MIGKIFFITLSLPFSVFAFCPVCTVAVASGVGLCRYLGIDDLISGTWIGGFLISLVIWTINELDKRQIKFFGRKPLIFIFWYGIAILPFYWLGILGHPQNKFLGIDKLIFGIFSGSIGLLMGYFLDFCLRKRNQGKVYFKFQKVVIPLFILVLLSLIFLKVC